MDVLFDLPLLLTGPLIILAHALFAVVGLVVVRRYLLPRLRLKTEDSEFTATMIQSIMVFYGLAVALIAVNVWQTYSDASKIVSEEVTALTAFYRDVSTYPEPARSRLQADVRDYLDNVIQQEWPMQRRGEMPTSGIEIMTRIQSNLGSFEPATEGQKCVHTETLGAYNRMIHARRLRLDALGAGLPVILWLVIVLGAACSLVTAFFFRVEDVRVHAIHLAILAAFMGLIVFLIVALDRPFRGDLGIRPDAFQLNRDHMKP